MLFSSQFLYTHRSLPLVATMPAIASGLSFEELEARIAALPTQDELDLADERLEVPAVVSRCIPTCRHGHIRFCPPSCRHGDTECPGPWQAKRQQPQPDVTSFAVDASET